MAILTRVPRLYRPSSSVPDGSAIPITTFAALPSAGSVPGQLRQLSDVNNIIVQARDIWRPYGGSQVLAMRILNPVTVQNTSGAVAETIGPFPGGLVRAGMRLEMDVRYDQPGIGTASRSINLRIGTGAVRNIFYLINTLQSSSGNSEHIVGTVDVLSNGSAPHYGSANFGANSYTAANTFAALLPVVDFSAAWSADIFLQSAAETAVNITSASWAAGVATYGTSAVHTLAVGDKTVIAGITPTGYNVAAGAIVLSVPTTTSFTVAIASDPGAYTSGGTSSRISNMISQSYVLTLKG